MFESIENYGYYESAKGMTISHDRAIQEITKNHDTPINELRFFYSELGIHDHYDAQKVLTWLGY
tara:strand:+ start:1024 stop:1215 length:192 start_codon:yes stop_codon:yes gene_type:complete